MDGKAKDGLGAGFREWGFSSGGLESGGLSQVLPQQGWCCDMDVSTRNLMVSWQPYNGVEYTLGLNIFPFPPCLLPRVCRRASTRTPASRSAARPLRSRRIPRARRQQGRSRVTTPL